MTRLTEEMVVARTKQSDIGQVTKLNCWGSELADVRLLRRMHNVEVLSLSVNKIRSLEDFQHCRNLVELFVRKNEIADLSQILYLQSLPKLRNLWLEENPCANEEDYRYTVLRALPGLKTLDKIPVQPEEVQDAMRRGRELLPLQDQDQYWDHQQQPESRECSPPPATTPYQREQRVETSSQQQQSPPGPERPQQQLPQAQSQSETQSPDAPGSGPGSGPGLGVEEGRNGEEVPTRPSSTSASTSTSTPTPTPTSTRRVSTSTTTTSSQTSAQTMQAPAQQGSPVSQRSPPRCAVETQSATFTRKPSRDYIIRNADDMPVGGGGQYYYEDGELQYQRQSQVLPQQHVYEEPSVEDEPPVVLRQPHRVSNGGYHEGPINHGDNSSSDGSGGMYRERSRPVSTVEDESRQTYERNNRQTHERLSSAAQRLANDRITCNTNQRTPYPRRPITRSSNLLSAVLCLVKELDYPSLEVVEMAVKCRMDELED